MSFVMVRIFSQLSSKDSVAAGPPCMIIFYEAAIQYAIPRLYTLGKTHQSSECDSWNNRLCCPTIVEPS